MISHLHPPELQIPRRLGPESSETHTGTSPSMVIHRCKRGGRGRRQAEEGEARSSPSLPRGQFCSMVNHQWSFTKSKRPHYVQRLITPLFLLVFLSFHECINHLSQQSSISQLSRGPGIKSTTGAKAAAEAGSLVSGPRGVGSGTREGGRWL